MQRPNQIHGAILLDEKRHRFRSNDSSNDPAAIPLKASTLAMPLIQNVATIRGIQCDGLPADRACVPVDENQKSIHYHAMHPDIH
jgi:hypothetical protein